MQQEDKKTETFVQEYIRCVPKKYHRGPQRIDIKLDKNNEAIITLRNREFLIHVIDQEPKPAPAQQTLWQVMFGRK
jgi:hypothetical protein